MLRVRVTARAAGEIERAVIWWMGNRPSAPDALQDDLAAAFNLLTRQPGIGTKVASERVGTTRRLHLGRVRYFIYYAVRRDELVVLSLWHSSRKAAPRV